MKWIIIILALSSFSYSLCQAQDETILFNEMPLIPEIEAVDPADSTLEYIIHKRHLKYSSPEQLKDIPQQSDYWFRYDLSFYLELFDKYDTLYLNTTSFSQGRFYYEKDQRIQFETINFFKNNRYKSKKVRRSFYPVTRDKLIDGRFIVFRVKAFLNGYRWKRVKCYLTNSNTIIVQEISVFKKYRNKEITVYLFLGLALALLIFNVLLYLYSRELVYFFYSLFMLFQSIYYSQIITSISSYLEATAPLLFYVSTNLIQIAINLAYLLFIQYFLEMPENYPRLNKVINVVKVGLIALIIADGVILSINPFFTYQAALMDFQRYFMALFALYGIIHLAIYRKSVLVNFVILGTISFVTGALLTMFFINIQYMVIGASMESFIFATGLVYKIKVIYDEKLNLEKLATKASQSALRAQINPHFIFNALNSIQHLITVNDKKSALKYLTKFSQLLRQILDNSIEVNVPLSKEISLLKLYLDLEALRFDQKFRYDIHVGEALDIHNLEMPLFLVQPYVENAIIHGLMPSDSEDKCLNIRFDDNGEFILCSIEDNGIGRAAARAHKKTQVYKSRGMSVTKQRLELINKDRSQKTLVSFVDDESGTKVIINIPKM